MAVASEKFARINFFWSWHACKQGTCSPRTLLCLFALDGHQSIRESEAERTRLQYRVSSGETAPTLALPVLVIVLCSCLLTATYTI